MKPDSPSDRIAEEMGSRRWQPAELPGAFGIPHPHASEGAVRLAPLEQEHGACVDAHPSLRSVSTVVIPAKDESDSIVTVIRGCQRWVDRIIVVDGHSRDTTRHRAEQAGALVLLDAGKGKGEAIRRAIAHVDTEVTVLIDADGSHDPADIPRLVQPILDGEADHVSGSRLTGGSSELHGGFDEFLRLAGSSFITACINYRFRVQLSESQNGFRAIRTAILRRLGLCENGTTIEQEMIMKTLKRGFRMAEVPTHEYCRRSGESHIVLWRDAPRYVYSFLKYLL